MSDTSEKLHTFEEVRSRLKISERTLRRWISTGDLEVIHVGRQLRFEDKEIKRYIDLRRRARLRREQGHHA
jgi:excisionase family DNA binding protein